MTEAKHEGRPPHVTTQEVLIVEGLKGAGTNYLGSTEDPIRVVRHLYLRDSETGEWTHLTTIDPWTDRAKGP